MSQQLIKSCTMKNNIAIKLLKFNKNKMPVSSTRFIHTKTSKEMDLEINEPLKYTTSPANQWKAENSRTGNRAEFGPWYEPHIVSASVIGFMIYFCVLREENDIDLLLDKPLTDTLKKE